MCQVIFLYEAKIIIMKIKYNHYLIKINGTIHPKFPRLTWKVYTVCSTHANQPRKCQGYLWLSLKITNYDNFWHSNLGKPMYFTRIQKVTLTRHDLSEATLFILLLNEFNVFPVIFHYKTLFSSLYDTQMALPFNYASDIGLAIHGNNSHIMGKCHKVITIKNGLVVFKTEHTEKYIILFHIIVMIMIIVSS